MDSNSSGVGFRDISIGKGFWNNRQHLNEDTTIYAVLDRFKETGRFDAFKFDWKEGEPNRPHNFWDSDVAKWLEAAAYILSKKKDSFLENVIDEVVDLIEKNQDENGYFNIYFTMIEPEQRFKKRGNHELYCAGHLIEAAVAYYNATGKDKFLSLMRKYADYIEKVFKIERSAAFPTCGHEEIELALVKLYRATDEKRYLELGKYFVDIRGSENLDHMYEWGENAYYAQDHLPVREQCTAEGHAVRAAYLYCAMADLAYEYGDHELLAACRKIFENIVTKRMYITGGIGSSREGEAFTIDYDLPNITAYTESCAAIGLAQFARRMQLIDMDSIYSDIAERILYNGFLSTTSLDGKSFFYENPLEIHPELLKRDVCRKEVQSPLPIIQRKGVFDTSCCPPNITRFVASIGDFLYSHDEKTLYVHQYIPGTANIEMNGSENELVQQTQYPLDGDIKVTVKGGGIGRIAFRLPYWCENYSFRINGEAAEIAKQKGYAYISLPSLQTNTIDINFEMKVQFVEASPRLQENSGRIAIQRGPVVYCLEAVDNGDLLRDVRIDTTSAFELVPDEYFGIPALKTSGYRRAETGFDLNLYKPGFSELRKIELKFIPYFCFANRGESEMVIWVLKN